jgi:Outer membrane protein beta-barrel domain
MRKLYVAMFVLAVFNASAYSQVPSGNVFAGYSYLNAEFPENRVSLNGWNASLEIKLLKFLGVVGDFSGDYGTPGLAVFYPCPVTDSSVCPQPQLPATLNTSVREHAFLFGPRVFLQRRKFRPFAEATIGGGHLSTQTPTTSISNTALAYAVGIGLDYQFHRRFGWRAQVDALQTRFSGSSQSNVRASTGIVIKF